MNKTFSYRSACASVFSNLCYLFSLTALRQILKNYFEVFLPYSHRQQQTERLR